MNDTYHPPISDSAIGIGLRSPHHQQIAETLPEIEWLELHSENYFSQQSPQRKYLDDIAAHYPLSFHGIGLSLGSTDPLSRPHLEHLKALIDTYNPTLVSEHLSWSSHSGRYFNDLLPMPYTTESLDHFCQRVEQIQDYLGRQILIENPTAYLSFKQSNISECEFLKQLHQRTQCGLLLDLNNLYVNSINLGMDLKEYLNTIPVAAVKEIHLAGFTKRAVENGEILIDTHGAPISEPVWALFRQYRERCQAPALIEWDTDIPELHVLLAQAQRARQEQSHTTLSRIAV